jgi:hypothetical protein
MGVNPGHGPPTCKNLSAQQKIAAIITLLYKYSPQVRLTINQGFNA